MSRAANIIGTCALATGAAIAPLGAQGAPVATPASPHLVGMSVSARLRNVIKAHVMDDVPPDSAREKHDAEILSPKSARFNAEGTKVYVNSLEAGKTLVYEWPSLRKLRTIVHRFGPADSALFAGDSTVFHYPYFTHSPGGSANVFAR